MGGGKIYEVIKLRPSQHHGSWLLHGKSRWINRRKYDTLVFTDSHCKYIEPRKSPKATSISKSMPSRSLIDSTSLEFATHQKKPVCQNLLLLPLARLLLLLTHHPPNT